MKTIRQLKKAIRRMQVQLDRITRRILKEEKRRLKRCN